MESEITPREELRAFLFLAILLGPILSVIVVAGYGFAVWMSHFVTGLPTS